MVEFVALRTNKFARPSVKSWKGPSLATSVKADLHWGTSWLVQVKKKPRNGDHNKPEVTCKIERKLKDGDISGDVRVLSSEDSIAEPNKDVMIALKEKHPDPPLDLDTTVRVVDPHLCAVEVSLKKLAAALKFFSRSSGAGPDALSPAHLKDLASL